MTISRRLCELHGLSDADGNRLLHLKPGFASTHNPWPWNGYKVLTNRESAYALATAELSAAAQPRAAESGVAPPASPEHEAVLADCAPIPQAKFRPLGTRR